MDEKIRDLFLLLIIWAFTLCVSFFLYFILNTYAEIETPAYKMSGAGALFIILCWSFTKSYKNLRKEELLKKMDLVIFLNEFEGEEFPPKFPEGTKCKITIVDKNNKEKQSEETLRDVNGGYEIQLKNASKTDKFKIFINDENQKWESVYESAAGRSIKLKEIRRAGQ